MVIGDETATQQRPQRCPDRTRGQPRIPRQVSDKRSAAPTQAFEDALGGGIERWCIGNGGRRQLGHVFAAYESQKTGTAIVFSRACPGPLPTRNRLIEPARLV